MIASGLIKLPAALGSDVVYDTELQKQNCLLWGSFDFGFMTGREIYLDRWQIPYEPPGGSQGVKTTIGLAV
jgi:hypothetical protein